MKWICQDPGHWESSDGLWNIVRRGDAWRILYSGPMTDGVRAYIRGVHRTLASAKVAVVMFVEDAAR